MKLAFAPVKVKFLKEVVEAAAKDLKREMDIANLDHFQVSIDIRKNQTCPTVGVRITGHKIEEYELLYDFEVDSHQRITAQRSVK